MKLKTLFLALAPATAFAASIPTQVTFYKDVLPITQNRCQECHRNPANTRPYGRPCGELWISKADQQAAELAQEKSRHTARQR